MPAIDSARTLHRVSTHIMCVHRACFRATQAPTAMSEYELKSTTGATGSSIQSKLLALFVSSIWLIAAAAEPANGYKWELSMWRGTDFTGYTGYALSVGVVGAVFSLLTLIMAKFKPDHTVLRGSEVGVTIHQLIALFFVRARSVATPKPAQRIAPVQSRLRSARGSPALPPARRSPSSPQPLGAFSALVTAVLGALQVLWWGVGAGIGTFKQPFTVASNGYFALWAGFVFSLLLLGDVMEAC